jgi:uncharacterized protein (TIGR00288 family)
VNHIQADEESRVAILIDCDNVPPEILEYALLISAQFGRATIRRGYGNQRTLADRWRDVLVSSAFSPCLQYQYASGKNTADLALALDALEALFDERADVFCLVTSDSDFAYLCRKLRERGSMVYIIGEPKTPSALRNASDQFFEWIREDVTVTPLGEAGSEDTRQKAVDTKGTAHNKTKPQQRPIFVVKAVTLLASESVDDKVHLGQLGQYLKRTDPAFSPKTYGYTGLLEMLKTYDLLAVHKESAGGWSVSVVNAKH